MCEGGKGKRCEDCCNGSCGNGVSSVTVGELLASARKIGSTKENRGCKFHSNIQETDFLEIE